MPPSSWSTTEMTSVRCLTLRGEGAVAVGERNRTLAVEQRGDDRILVGHDQRAVGDDVAVELERARLTERGEQRRRLPRGIAAARIGQHQPAGDVRPRELRDLGRRLFVAHLLGIEDDDAGDGGRATQRCSATDHDRWTAVVAARQPPSAGAPARRRGPPTRRRRNRLHAPRAWRPAPITVTPSDAAELVQERARQHFAERRARCAAAAPRACRPQGSAAAAVLRRQPSRGAGQVLRLLAAGGR